MIRTGEDYPILMRGTREMLNLGDAGRRLMFRFFAQSSVFAPLAAVCRNFVRGSPLACVKDAADLSDTVMGGQRRAVKDSAISGWFSTGMATHSQRTAAQ